MHSEIDPKFIIFFIYNLANSQIFSPHKCRSTEKTHLLSNAYWYEGNSSSELLQSCDTPAKLWLPARLDYKETTNTIFYRDWSLETLYVNQKIIRMETWRLPGMNLSLRIRYSQLGQLALLQMFNILATEYNAIQWHQTKFSSTESRKFKYLICCQCEQGVTGKHILQLHTTDTNV